MKLRQGRLLNPSLKLLPQFRRYGFDPGPERALTGAGADFYALATKTTPLKCLTIDFLGLTLNQSPTEE
jgi:hypothetical protein